MGLGIVEYAAHRGVSAEAVRKAIVTGRIERLADGSIDPATADKQWHENTRTTMQEPGPLPPRRQQTPGVTEPVPGMQYQDARALKETYEAMRRKMELQVRAGELISRKEVEQTATHCYTVLREACFRLPARLSPMLAAESDEHTIYRLIEQAVRDVFEQFSEGKLT